MLPGLGEAEPNGPFTEPGLWTLLSIHLCGVPLPALSALTPAARHVYPWSYKECGLWELGLWVFLLLLFIFFDCGMWDLSSPHQGSNPCPMHWEHWTPREIPCGDVGVDCLINSTQ